MKPARPLLVYDGECSFCRRWIARWRHMTGDRVGYAPFQEVAHLHPAIPRERFASAVQLIEPDGHVSQGAEAVFRTLSYVPRLSGWLTLYRGMPPFAAASEWFYRLVARHRDVFDRITRGIWGDHLVPPGNALTCWIFMRVLGVTFLVAMLSLWSQVIGLIGHDGILPAATFLHGVAERYGAVRFWFLPTLSWLGASDTALHVLCAVGTLLAIALTVGFAPLAALIGVEAIYLSLVTVGQDFFWFQWDSLLLETGFLAIFLVPWRLWSRPLSEPEPPRAGRFLLLWLLFRLMFSSAMAKLGSGDPTWRNLTALTFHYETQPLPPWSAWFMHHLPVSFHRFSAAWMFVIEGLLPFLIPAPRRIRFVAAGAMIGLQALIIATGNYGFFNLLAIALCLLVLDDGVWPRRWREVLRRDVAAMTPDAAPPRASGVTRSAVVARGALRWPAWITGPAVILMFAISLVPLLSVMRQHIPRPLNSAYQLISPLRIVNGYGLFAVMTTQRDEVVIEGSMDGVTWTPYEFVWKPGDPKRRPEFMAPHMPRLDWQMWFAALSDYRSQSWFLWLCQRLLEGDPTVLAMLRSAPFADRPPLLLRASRWRYHFSDAATRRETGAWWTRERLGLYCPPLTLRDGQLMFVGGE